MPERWRAIRGPWGYCAVRSGDRALTADDQAAVASELGRRLFQPAGSIYDGGVHSLDFGSCTIPEVAECPSGHCPCLSVAEARCALAIVDVAAIVEREIERLGLGDATMFTCLRFAGPPELDWR